MRAILPMQFICFPNLVTADFTVTTFHGHHLVSTGFNGACLVYVYVSAVCRDYSLIAAQQGIDNRYIGLCPAYETFHSEGVVVALLAYDVACLLAVFVLAVSGCLVVVGAGEGFVSAIASGGYWWILYGVIITMLPLLITGVIARKVFKLDYFSIF